MSTPDKFEKEAAKQRLYMVLLVLLVVQTVLIIALFVFGVFNENIGIIRTLILVELVIFGIVYAYAKLKAGRGGKS